MYNRVVNKHLHNSIFILFTRIRKAINLHNANSFMKFTLFISTIQPFFVTRFLVKEKKLFYLQSRLMLLSIIDLYKTKIRRSLYTRGLSYKMFFFSVFLCATGKPLHFRKCYSFYSFFFL